MRLHPSVAIGLVVGLLTILVMNQWRSGLLFLGQVGGGNLLQDGSFEDLADTGTDGAPAGSPLRTLSGRPASAWVVKGGKIDVVNGNPPYWGAADGTASIDLNGPSLLAQSIAVTPGSRYLLSFSLSSNPDGGPMKKTIGIRIQGAQTEGTSSFSFTPREGHRSYSMIWERHELVFTALASSITINVETTDSTFFGPLFDAAAIQLVGGVSSSSAAGATCGNGLVEDGEQCDGDVCCDSACQWKPATTECRPAEDACDLAETCSGNSAQCPADALKNAGVLCRQSTAGCDPDEVCTGTSPQCSADVNQCGGSSSVASSAVGGSSVASSSSAVGGCPQNACSDPEWDGNEECASLGLLCRSKSTGNCFDCVQPTSSSRSSLAATAVCRNAKREGTEECDDGNASNSDACTNQCKNAQCGDRIIRTDKKKGEEGYEECDPPDGGLCKEDCRKPAADLAIIPVGGMANAFLRAQAAGGVSFGNFFCSGTRCGDELLRCEFLVENRGPDLTNATVTIESPKGVSFVVYWTQPGGSTVGGPPSLDATEDPVIEEVCPDGTFTVGGRLANRSFPGSQPIPPDCFQRMRWSGVPMDAPPDRLSTRKGAFSLWLRFPGGSGKLTADSSVPDTDLSNNARQELWAPKPPPFCPRPRALAAYAAENVRCLGPSPGRSDRIVEGRYDLTLTSPGDNTAAVSLALDPCMDPATVRTVGTVLGYGGALPPADCTVEGSSLVCPAVSLFEGGFTQTPRRYENAGYVSFSFRTKPNCNGKTVRLTGSATFDARKIRTPVQAPDFLIPSCSPDVLFSASPSVVCNKGGVIKYTLQLRHKGSTSADALVWLPYCTDIDRFEPPDGCIANDQGANSMRCDDVSLDANGQGKVIFTVPILCPFPQYQPEYFPGNATAVVIFPPVGDETQSTTVVSTPVTTRISPDACSTTLSTSSTSTSSSSSSSTAAVCGNGRIEPGEACDDGNTVDDDCCAAACTVEFGCICTP